MIGTNLAHFRILDQLGAGATGQVYLAEDTKLGRQVALKVLPPDLEDSVSLERFEREARTVARLNHPNIVTLHSIEESDGQRFLCMERVEGATLDGQIPDSGMAVDRFFALAVPLASALAAAHAAGVVHRDLKPANVMVGERLKVLDFGLAKLRKEPGKLAAEADAPAPLTQDGHVMGTLVYMAPEQLAGEEADARTDVFALGVIFFEMLTGGRPFRGPGLPKLIEEITLKDAPRASDRRGDLPRPLVDLVDRCLQKEPADRYQNAAELRFALDELAAELLSGSAGNALPPPPTTPRRRRGLSVATALLGAAAAGGLYLLTSSPSDRAASPPVASRTEAARKPEPRPTRVLVLPFTVQGNDELAYLSHGLVDLLSTKLDGAGELRSVDPRAGLARAPGSVSPAEASQAAKDLEAGLFVLGTLLAVGPQIQLTASLYETGEASPPRSLEPAAQASVAGDSDNLFDLIDELTAQLLAGRGGEGPGQRITRIAAVTTHSLPALKAYLSGESAFRAGRFQDAFEAFSQAVAQDPGFALAWYRLSTVAEWMSNDEMSQRGATEAFANSERLSDHDRRLLEGFSAGRRGEVREAANIYREILATYPDDVEAWFQLGEIAFHFDVLEGEPIAAAREPWQQVLRYEPDHVVALLHLARLAAARGDLAELDTLAERFLAASPSGERSLEMRALSAFSHRDEAAIQQVTAQLRQASDVTLYISAAAVACYVEDFAGARRLLRLMTEPSRFQEIRWSGHVLLADLEIGSGRLGAARRELEAAEPLRFDGAIEHLAYLTLLPFLEPAPEELEDTRRRLEAWHAAATPDVPQRVAGGVHNGLYQQLEAYLLGLAAVASGRTAEARHQVETLRSVSQPETARLFAGDLAAGVAAAVNLAEGDAEAALSELEAIRRATWIERRIATSPFFSRARERYLRAELLATLGRDEEALRWYSSFAHQSIHSLAFLASSHDRRAHLLERLGRPREAAEHLRRFLTLWADADPELQPRLQDARRRLERLEAAGE